MALSGIALLRAKMKRDQQVREKGITDEREAQLRKQQEEREQTLAKARATEAARPKPPKNLVLPNNQLGGGLLDKLLAKQQADKGDAEQPTTEDNLHYNDEGNVEVAVTLHTDTSSLGKSNITYDMLNSKQKLAVQYGGEGISFCLIGGAGTGKTTTQRSLISKLISDNIISKLSTGTEKVLSAGSPAVAVLSFTNKAVSNIKAALPKEIKHHCATIHKLLEFKPEDVDKDEVDSYGQLTGETITTRRFTPTYGKMNDGLGDDMTLPHLDVVIVEEAGSVPLELFNILVSALPCSDETVFIFLGDLNQLPPVFGDAVLGYALLDLPIVELTEVYRQALLSPITKLATTIQKGRAINDAALQAMAGDFGEHGILEVFPFKPVANKLCGTPEDKARMAHNFGKVLYNLTIEGFYNPDEDAVLIPFNKAFGTIELSKWVGQALRDMRDLDTYHVKAGREDHYLCVGDKVMFDKVECRIESIETNEKYLGEPTLVASKLLDRWGRNKGSEFIGKEFKSFEEMAEALDQLTIADGEEKVNQCSHVIRLISLEDPDLDDLERPRLIATTAAEVNSFVPMSVLTVHKSQGSEWPKVLLVLHTSHATMWSRELIYTAVTRARHHLRIYYSGEQSGKINGSAFQKGVIKSEFKGISLADKLVYFRNKRKATELNMAAQAKREGTELQPSGMRIPIKQPREAVQCQ